MTLLFPTLDALADYLRTGKRGTVARKQGQWVFKEAV